MDRESHLIQLLQRHASHPAGGFGIGDDCAVLPCDDQTSWLISTDALVENTHFQLSWLTAAQLAHKSMMVNVSDIAAMGGTPCFILLTLGLPTSHSTVWAEQFIEHLSGLLSSLNITLIGGDTVLSDRVLINVTILGKAPLTRIKYRHGGQPGDILCVSKALGGAHAGLQCLQGHWQGDSEACLAQQLTPVAQLAQGQWLSQHGGVHAMMDVSDGLSVDVIKLCQASGLGADIVPAQILVDPDAARLAVQNGCIPWHIAYVGGEDYALLCAIAAKDWPQLSVAYRQQFQQDLIPIGTLCDKHAEVRLLGVDTTELERLKPFRHFSL